MAKEFIWHCGASVLVDDAYSIWEVKASNATEAFDKAMKHLNESNVLDTGSLSIYMDTTELATELGNIASGDFKDWTPAKLVEELTPLKDTELYGTLEEIVCNYYNL